MTRQMSLIRLSWAYLAQRPLTTALNIILMALGVATITVLALVAVQTEGRLARDAANVDLVVGAKGSPLQVILSALYQMDVPTGNIPLSEAERVTANPMVARAIPIAMGDSFRGFTIVGTTPDYLDLFGARVAEGTLWEGPMRAVLGADVAQRTGAVLGDYIVGTHGMGDAGGGADHHEHPYEVVGILAPTGTVADRVVLTAVESVWDVHGAAHGDEATGVGREITALLIQYASPLAAAKLPREINATTALQAASPAQELARLLSLLGTGLDAVRVLAGVLVLSAGASVFVALYNALQQRRYDLAVMRSLGGTRGRLTTQLVVEALMITGAGTLLGLLLGHGLAEAAGQLTDAGRDMGLTGLTLVAGDLWLLGLGAAIALVAAALPAYHVYRSDVSAVLARG